MPVLQARSADVARRYAQPPRDLLDEPLRPEAAFLDPQEQVFAAAARFVRGDLLDLEILGLRLETAADAEQVGRQIRW